MTAPKSHNSAWVCSLQHPRCVHAAVRGVLCLYPSAACLGTSGDGELIRVAMVLQGVGSAPLRPPPLRRLCSPLQAAIGGQGLAVPPP